MQTLRFAINVTLDGCIDHEACEASPELHRHASDGLASADTLLFGRRTYQLMESAWREPAATGVWPDWMTDWMRPFAHTMHAARKIVVTDTLAPAQVDWNATLVRGADLIAAVQRLRAQPGRGVAVCGSGLARSLAALGLIDEYEFIVHPRIAGRGPTLFAGLPVILDLQSAGETAVVGGVVARRYRPRAS
jgi:dihydrofolate reductase